MNNNQSITDEDLIKLLQHGDKTVLVVLVKRWHKTFCDKAYSLVKDKAVAKDIAQDSWSIIMLKIGSLKNPKQFKYWAFRIVYNRSLDYLRHTSKYGTTSLENTSEFKTQTDLYSGNEIIKVQLSKAIQELPAHQNEVIKLFYLQDFSLRQISKQLNISVGTLKSRLFYAREKLKIILKNAYYEN